MAFGCVPQVASQVAEHQARRRQLDERLTGLDLALIVLGQASVPRQPRETMFNNPPARLHLEVLGAWLSLHHLQVPAVALLSAPVGQFFPR
jgi:hypothetical protein